MMRVFPGAAVPIRLPRWARLLPLALAAVLAGFGCGRETERSWESAAATNASVRGTPILRAGRASFPSNTVAGPGATNRSVAATQAILPVLPPVLESDGFLRLGFGLLSNFKYEVYEYYVEGMAGRPLLKSDDVIPENIRKFNGTRAVVRGFVLPLRTRKGRVTEFLLMRDQGTCCFGPQAQINHFMRVNYPAGAEFESGLPYQVRGVLRVGETYVQGYLTGIYQLEAQSVERSLE